MKIAIVADWLVAVGGAEKFLGQLINCYPQADLFAVVDFVKPEQRSFLQNKSINTTFIQHLPFAKTRYRTYLPFMPLAIEQLNLSAYDLILSSSHAVSKGVMIGPNQLHISYVHSPMRYAWDLQHQYLQETGLDRKLHGWLVRYLLHKLRLWDTQTANHVDYFATNSQFIARRIEKTYRRQAEVIYPPIDLTQFKPGTEKEDFYLTASRLVPYKKIDLIVSAFNARPHQQLVVIGDGPDFEKIKRIAGPNVKMLGYQSEAVLISYLQRAKAFLFAALEDFGLLPLEAQACGTPVIAYGKGGVLETVRDVSHPHPTGLFFEEQTEEALNAAIDLFETNQAGFQKAYCLENAARFSPEQFQTKFKHFVSQHLITHHIG